MEDKKNLKEYSDRELFSFMEENNIELTYSNMVALRESISDEEKEKVREEISDKIPEVKNTENAEIKKDESSEPKSVESTVKPNKETTIAPDSGITNKTPNETVKPNVDQKQPQQPKAPNVVKQPENQVKKPEVKTSQSTVAQPQPRTPQTNNQRINQSGNSNIISGSSINVGGSAQIGGQFNNNSGNSKVNVNNIDPNNKVINKEPNSASPTVTQSTPAKQVVRKPKIQVTDEMRKVYRGKKVDANGNPLTQEQIDKKIRASISSSRSRQKVRGYASKWDSVKEALDLALDALDGKELNEDNFRRATLTAFKLVSPLTENLFLYQRSITKEEVLTEASAVFQELERTTPKQTILTGKYSSELLENILLSCGMELNEYQNLSEDTKIESVKYLAVQLLNTINDKLSEIDTSQADRSRGDIKLLKELPAIQDAISQLESMIERDENALPSYSVAVATVIKAILYINQYSSVFKDAYRNKKSLMILKYQSLILSIISSISYIISMIVDFKADHLTLKRNVEGLENFAPLKSLAEFIKSVDNGEFKISAGDVSIMREHYLEINIEDMGSILEASEYLPMVVNGIKNIYTNIANNDKITNLVYKVVGVIVLIFSLRSSFYTLFRMKTKISDMIAGIQNFAGLNNGGGVLSKLSQFVNKFRNDSEMASDISKREIEDENKKLLLNVREIQRSEQIPASTEIKQPEPIDKQNGGNIFGFDF